MSDKTIQSLTEKATLVAGDYFVVADSEDDYAWKKTTQVGFYTGFASVWPAWSWATYTCDWVNDEEEIQAAIDTWSPVELLEGTYVISWEILLDSWTTITGAGKWQTTLSVSWITTWSIFRTRTLASRIYRATLSWFRMTKTYNAGHTVKWVDFSQLSISVFKEIEMSWFNHWVYASWTGTYYNNFWDITVTGCGYNFYISTTTNENRFFGWRSDSSYLWALYLASCNTVNFFWVSFEWTDENLNMVSAESCCFYWCRFEMYWTSDVNFDTNSFGCMILGWHSEWTVTFTDNGKNTILISDEVRSDKKGVNNTNWWEYEHKWAWQDTNAVHQVWSSYSASGKPAIYRGISRRFDAMTFEAIYDNGSTQKRTFWVESDSGNIYTLSPDGNAWLIWVSNAGAITVTSTSTFTL